MCWRRWLGLLVVVVLYLVVDFLKVRIFRYFSFSDVR